MSSVPSILLVESESATRSIITDRLRECGFRVIHTISFQEAAALLGSRAVAVDLVFSDTHITDERDALEFTRWARLACPGLSVIVATGAAQADGLCDQLHALGPIEAELHRTGGPPELRPDLVIRH